MADKVYLVRFSLCRLISALFLVMRVNLPCFVRGRGGTFTKGVLCSAFRQRVGGKFFLDLLLLSGFQLKIILYPHVKVAHYGVAYHDPLQGCISLSVSLNISISVSVDTSIDTDIDIDIYRYRYRYRYIL